MNKILAIGLVLILSATSLMISMPDKVNADTTERNWIPLDTNITADSSNSYRYTGYIRVNESDVLTFNCSGSSGAGVFQLGFSSMGVWAINWSSLLTECYGTPDSATYGNGWNYATYQYVADTALMYPIHYFVSWGSNTDPQPVWIRVSAPDVIYIKVASSANNNVIFNFSVERGLPDISDFNNTLNDLSNSYNENITKVNQSISQLNQSLDALNSTMDQIDTNLTNAINITNTLLDFINNTLTNAVNDTNTLLNSINDTLANAIDNTNIMLNSVNSKLNSNLSYLWASYANLLKNITRLNDQYNALQAILNNFTLSNNTVTIYQNNTILAQWDAINATLANISSLQQRMTNVENNNATSYNDSAIHKQLDNLQDQLNNTKPATETIYQNNTAADTLAKALGVTGIIIGFIGVGIAALSMRRKKKEEPIPESSPTEAQSAAPPIAMQYTPITKEEPAPLIPVIAPEEQVPTTIEDVFLLYNDGRLLSHQTRRLKPGVDDAILGGMLTAVQSFIQESFSGDDEEAIKTLEYGSMKIIIERHEKIYLATVMSGDEPKNLRKDMRHLLMDIWDSHKDILSKWDGDTNKLKKINGMIKQFIKWT